MIKIISRMSAPGGSTRAYCDLTNLFNKNGINTIFYGPHEFHTTLCKGKQIKSLDQVPLTFDDTVILHYIDLPKRLPVKKVILSCHEKHSFIPSMRLISNQKYWDKLHFITEEQRVWHSIFKDECIIIGNPMTLDFTIDTKTKQEIAGVIGSIELRKRTLESVESALQNGYNQVYLYGSILDPSYFESILKKHPNKVTYKGYVTSKKEMYESIDAVYHMSRWEVACLVQGECKLLGIPFYGSEFCPEYPIWSEEKVLNAWKEEFNR